MADPGERAGFSDPHIRRRRRDGSSAAPLQLFLPSPAGPRPALASRAALHSRGRASRAAPARRRHQAAHPAAGRDAARAVAGTRDEAGTRGRCRRSSCRRWQRPAAAWRCPAAGDEGSARGRPRSCGAGLLQPRVASAATLPQRPRRPRRQPRGRDSETRLRDATQRRDSETARRPRDDRSEASGGGADGSSPHACRVRRGPAAEAHWPGRGRPSSLADPREPCPRFLYSGRAFPPGKAA